MFEGAPRTLVVLLVIVVILRILLALLESNPPMFILLQIGLFGFYAWRTLQGRESAAKVFSVFLVLGALMDIYGIYSFVRVGASAALIFLIVPIFHLAVGVYIFRSKAVAAYFSSKTYASYGS